MNERPHDDDKPLKFLDKVWAEDYLVCDPISRDKKKKAGQGVFVTLELVALPMNDR